MNGKWIPIVTAVAGFTLVLLSASYGLQEWMFESGARYYLRERAKALEALIPKYNEIQERFGHFEIFKYRASTLESSRNADSEDASSFLDYRVQWLDMEGKAVSLSDVTLLPQTPGPYFLPIEELKWGNADGFDFSRLDFSVLQLKKFTFWDTTKAKPAQEAFTALKERKVSPDRFFARLVRPVFQDLIQLAKLRLMHGLRARQLLAALSEVRQLARLCYSTETFSGAKAAISLLMMEADAYQYGVRTKRLDPRSWTPAPDLSNLPRGGFYDTLGFYGIYSTSELLEATVGHVRNTVGKCATIVHGMPMIAQIVPYLLGSFPEERNDFSTLVSNLKKVATDPTNGCRIPFVRYYWENLADSSDSSQAPMWARIARPVPYLRRAAALQMLASPGGS